jgi:hypothetical protein
MKYYNKDYENFVIDENAEIRVEKQRQDEEEIREIKKSQRLFKSRLDVYRERNNGYPSLSILFLSLFAAAIITMIPLMAIGFTLINLKIITQKDFGKILGLGLLWPFVMVMVTYVILNYCRKFFARDDNK